MSITDIAVARAERALDRQYFDGIDADDARASEIGKAKNDIELLIRAGLMAGFAGEKVALPFIQTGVRRGAFVESEATESVREAVVGMADVDSVWDALAELLAYSTCPYVRAYRVAMTDSYVKDNAEQLARLRCAK